MLDIWGVAEYLFLKDMERGGAKVCSPFADKGLETSPPSFIFI
jgi:hypothetical protein